MIRLENVSKVYHTAKGDLHALKEVTLDIAAGEFVAVCGPSGCGKSTLLSLIGGLAKPTAGRIEVAGQEISHLPPGPLAHFRGSHIGFVFQMFHLLPYLDVLHNVLVCAPTQVAETGARERAEQLLVQFGLQDRLTHRPGQLSAGERQRVAMARALLHEPALLLADEPTGNLDPQSAEALLDLLGDFRGAGGTILLVTHDARAGERADRVVRLRSGQLDLTDAPPQGISGS
ncbi:MAG TPA: ABC transporter ATP-binding protein [Planctomycetaceae bacterium]|nr:ABC transporter ATP-binding protein [Blastopirellula sp.]HAY81816.1 ABC transporter ATP-binding protein [Planctomycetaceae bacterium]|tara:strand:+ start:224 stop:916 length:693 start_codon:yes stop_codon:yes gene_type:complete